MHGRLIALSVLAGIIVPASAAVAAQGQPAAVPGRIGIRLIDIPSVASAELLAHSYIVGRLAPGTRITRQIEITNSTSSTANVSVYAAGATQHRSIFGLAPGHSPNELSSWTSVSRHIVRMLSRTKTLDTVTINVPKDASSGERYAVV